MHVIEKKRLTFEDAVGLALFTATHEGPPGALAAFTSVAGELLYFASREKLIYFDELDQAKTAYFITKATLGKAFPTTEVTHIRRNLLMLIHLAANIYGINVPKYAAEVSEIKERIGGPRRPMMDDEIALTGLPPCIDLFKGKASYVPVETLAFLAPHSGEWWNRAREVANLPRSPLII
jgi:hypothetical protein